MADIDCDLEISLENLPSEIISQICGDLSTVDHFNLLQVSRRLRDNGIETLYQTRVCTVHNNYARESDSKRCDLESFDKSIARSIPLTNGRVGPLDCKIRNLDVEVINKNCITGRNKPLNWIPTFDASIPRKRCAITIRHDSQKPMQEAKKGIVEFMRVLHHFEEVTLKFRSLYEHHPTDSQDRNVVRSSQTTVFHDYQHELEAGLGRSELHESEDVNLRYLSWKPLESNRARAREDQELHNPAGT